MLKQIILLLTVGFADLYGENPNQGIVLSKAVFKEQKVWINYQQSKIKMIPARETKNGDILVYVNQVVNKTAVAKRKVTVSNPIPYGTAYLRGTASCEGSCEMLFSIDGGGTFKDSSELFVVYGAKKRIPMGSEYTHIKYIFNTVLPFEKIRMAFKAVVK